MTFSRLLVVSCLSLALGCQADVAQRTESIVGGVEVGTCGFPTTVLVGNGCTGTLVHPEVVVTAAHCGSPRTVMFGERAGTGMTRGVTCRAVPGFNRDSDVQFCVLDAPVDLPVTPILYGCELDELVVGAEVVITGFGLTADGASGSFGTQRWSFAPLRDVRVDHTLIGTPEMSACRGDSGGPVFLQLDDGAWRVFGSVSGGTTGIPCNGDGYYPRLDAHVPWFESTFGIDITPCHTADGLWDPGPDCGGFFAGDHTGGQSWADMCAGAAVSGPSMTCGAPDVPDAGMPDAGMPDAGMPDAGAVDAGPGVTTETDAGPGEEPTDGGCSCRMTPGEGAPHALWLLGLGILLAVRRRRP